MQTTIEKTVHRRLQKAAREYRQRGYEVILSPSKAETPDFLADFDIQMLARKEAENVIVEVRSRREELQTCLREMAAIVEKRPHWRLDVIVTNPKPVFPLDNEADLLDAQQMRERLSQAETLAQNGSPEAGLLLAWSATEVILRRLAQQEKVRLNSPQPELLLKTLVYEGVIDRDAYEIFQQSLSLRNLLIHGYRTSPVEKDFVSHVVGMALRNLV